jgi:mRNA interferase MazF
MVKKFNFGEIWLVNLNLKTSKKPVKSGLVLIVQNQALLDIGHPSTIIIPLTSQLTREAEPLRVRIRMFDKLENDSELMIDQIRSIATRRLINGPMAQCDASVMEKVQKAITEVFGF